MQFKYVALTKEGSEREGSIEAASEEAALSALQRRELIVASIVQRGKGKFFEKDMQFFQRVSTKEIVVLSRQIATLFDAQVSALQAFVMLGQEVENKLLATKLEEIANDIRGGLSISDALSKHPSVFSNFYANMVRSGEEAGKLSEAFMYLADYMDRNYELQSKVRGALIYPAFVIMVFIGVMVLLLTMVIPQLAGILTSAGAELPLPTKIVIGLSDGLVHYGIFIVLGILIVSTAVWYANKIGSISLSDMKLSLPVFGNLYKKLYLSRLADNMFTMLSSGVPMIKAIEVTGDVVDNKTFEFIMRDAADLIKTGSPVSEALSGYEEIPKIMILMIKVGEETGELASILKVMAKFYRREVENAIEGVIGLIEPAMIVLLGAGVGLTLAAVLIPMYSITDVM